MRFLKRFARRAAVVPPPSEPPEPHRPTGFTDNANPIRRWLDDLGPPRREAIEARPGMHPGPFHGWTIIAFDTAEHLPGFMTLRDARSG